MNDFLPFFDLPLDIFNKIGGYLDLLALFNARLSCKYLRSAFNYEFVERYKRSHIIKDIFFNYRKVFILYENGELLSHGADGHASFWQRITKTKKTQRFQELTDIRQVSRGGRHILILRRDGTVWGKGYEVHTIIFGLEYADHETFGQIPGITDVAEIATGIWHSLFLKKDGTVWGVGSNRLGQLGQSKFDYTHTVCQIEGLPPIKHIVASGNLSFFLDQKDDLWACGHPLGTKSKMLEAPILLMNDVQDIVSYSEEKFSGTSDHFFIVKKDGTLWGAGINIAGRLGLKTNDHEICKLQKISSAIDIKQASTSIEHSLFLKRDGSAWVCGRNKMGENDNVHYSLQPITNINNVRRAATGTFSTLFIDNDERVWGTGQLKELGLGPNTSTPILLPSLNNWQLKLDDMKKELEGKCPVEYEEQEKLEEGIYSPMCNLL